MNHNLMPQRRLDNYMRTYRKRSSLTQEELAFLLGGKTGTKVSRYERGARQPSLEAAIALSVVLCVPLEELFAGRFARIRARVEERARELSSQLRSSRKGAPERRERLLAALDAILET